MHSTDLSNSNVPAFLVKLWKIVEDPNCDSLIGWSSSGNSFIIHNQVQFSKALLPLYFKHSNMASFIRQLNMYGFRKLSSIEQGSLHSDRDEIEFYHQYFTKGNFSHLANIKRKIPAGKGQSEVLKEVIDDVNTIRAGQENVDALLKAVKEENSALWREVAMLRQKHMKQQQIVEKLIQFLASIVKPNCKIGMKRSLPLMIDNGSSCVTESKLSRLSQQLPKDSRKLKSSFCETSSSPMASGPVIHDVTDTLEDDLFPNVTASSVASPKESSLGSNPESSNILPVNASSAVMEPLIVLQESPLSLQEVLSPQVESVIPNNELLEDKSLDTPAVLLDPPTPSSLFPNAIFSKPDSKDDKIESTEEMPLAKGNLKSNNNEMQLAVSTSNDLSKNSFSDHLDLVEGDLDWLQDQILSGGLNIDSSALLGLFSADDPLSGTIFPHDTEKEDGNAVRGTELIQYTPSTVTSLVDFPTVPISDEFSSLPDTDDIDLPTLSVDPLLCDQ